jgi:hypothetical protein
MRRNELTHRLSRRACVLSLPLSAWRKVAAQEPPPSGPTEFDIPAGPLDATLLAIGRSTGTLVSFKPTIVATHQSQAIRGRFTVKQALALALQSSGLSFHITPSGVVTVVQQRPGSAQAPASAGADIR